MSDSRNPYISEGGTPALREFVTAYIDILGYSERIRQAHRDGSEQNVLIDFRRIIGKTYEYVTPQRTNSSRGKDFFEVKTFSDNVVIGYPICISGNAEFELTDILLRIAAFQLFMSIDDEYFLRGAITIGDLYIDNDIVFGCGLVEAHDIEQETSRDPRIVLSKSICKHIKCHINDYGCPKASSYYEDVFQDADGQWFLNYLNIILINREDIGPLYDELRKHKETVEKKLKDCAKEPAIWSKYAWVANYHNYFCDQNISDIDQSFKIDLTRFQTHPKRIV